MHSSWKKEKNVLLCSFVLVTRLGDSKKTNRLGKLLLPLCGQKKKDYHSVLPQ